MSLQIIIRGRNKYGKSRSEQEANLRKDGYVGMSDENFDKCKYLEKKIGAKEGWFTQSNISDADKIKR